MILFYFYMISVTSDQHEWLKVGFISELLLYERLREHGKHRAGMKILGIRGSTRRLQEKERIFILRTYFYIKIRGTAQVLILVINHRALGARVWIIVVVVIRKKASPPASPKILCLTHHLHLLIFPVPAKKLE